MIQDGVKNGYGECSPTPRRYLEIHFDKQPDFSIEKRQDYSGRVEFHGVDFPDEMHNHEMERQRVYAK